MSDGDNDFREWRIFIVEAIKRLGQEIDCLTGRIEDIRVSPPLKPSTEAMDAIEKLEKRVRALEDDRAVFKQEMLKEMMSTLKWIVGVEVTLFITIMGSIAYHMLTS